jgi:hypothetical protein
MSHIETKPETPGAPVKHSIKCDFCQTEYQLEFESMGGAPRWHVPRGWHRIYNIGPDLHKCPKCVEKGA